MEEKIQIEQNATAPAEAPQPVGENINEASMNQTKTDAGQPDSTKPPTENATLMKMARESLKGKWGVAIGVFAIMFFIEIIIQISSKYIPFGGLAYWVVYGPLSLGATIFALNLSRNKNAEINQVFAGFERFLTAMGAFLWVTLFTFLWSLLLIIPGIVASYSYMMTFYIIADDNSIGIRDAVKKSKKMMYGYKKKLFYLSCRFIGWALLCFLTLGIGFLWLVPYMQISIAKFYDDIKGDQLSVEKV